MNIYSENIFFTVGVCVGGGGGQDNIAWSHPRGEDNHGGGNISREILSPGGKLSREGGGTR